jgi:PKD repeat protein
VLPATWPRGAHALEEVEDMVARRGRGAVARAVLAVGLALGALMLTNAAPPARAQPGRLGVRANGPYTGQVGTPVVFTATVQLGGRPPDTPVQVQWSFGDGTIGFGAVTSHTYTTPGTYPVTVTATVGPGQQASDVTRATITGNQPLQVSAGGPYSGRVGEPIAMMGSVSGGGVGPVTFQPQLTPVQFHWHFGDGGEADGQFVTHAYSAPGTYPVTLQVTTASGQTGFATTTARVGGAGPLQVNAGGPYSGDVGQPILFSGSASGGPFGTQYIYQWSFGDGGTAVGQAVTHTYAAAGYFPVTLTVTTTAGQTGTGTTAAQVGQPIGPLQASANGPYSGTVGQPVTFTASVTGAPFGTQVSYHWHFGDGTSGDGQTVTHTYLAGGIYPVTLQVTTSAGQTAFDSTTATITAQPVGLQVQAGGPYFGMVGVPVTLSGAAPGAFQPQFQWSFGDGTTGAGQVVTHVYGIAGAYTATLTVTDLATGQTGQGTTTVVISGAPPPPSGAGPAPRYDAVTAFNPTANVMVLFGGCCDALGNSYGDTWLFDGTTWTQVTPAVSPAPRSDAVMVYDAGRGVVVLFGGLQCQGSNCLNLGDTWMWDGTAWTQQFPVTSPPARHGATMVYDAATRLVVLFGGQTTGEVNLNDLWTWDGSNWTPVFPVTVS